MTCCSALQSPVPLKLLDMPGHVAISSLSPPNPVNGNATLATYRYQLPLNSSAVGAYGMDPVINSTKRLLERLMPQPA